MKKNQITKISYDLKLWSLGYNCTLHDIEQAYLEKIILQKKSNLVIH